MGTIFKIDEFKIDNGSTVIASEQYLSYAQDIRECVRIVYIRGKYIGNTWNIQDAQALCDAIQAAINKAKEYAKD